MSHLIVEKKQQPEITVFGYSLTACTTSWGLVSFPDPPMTLRKSRANKTKKWKRVWRLALGSPDLRLECRHLLVIR